MSIKRVVKVTDKNGDVVFEIDFQETSQEYRMERINKMMEKYPQSEFIWEPFEEE